MSQPRRLACESCREHKLKCIPSSENDPTVGCTRCSELSQSCVYIQGRYGSSSKRKRQNSEKPTHSNGSSSHNNHHNDNGSGMMPSRRISVGPPGPSNSIPTGNTSSSTDSYPVQQHMNNGYIPPPRSNEREMPLTFDIDVSAHLDPGLALQHANSANPSPSGSVSEEMDPISMQYISHMEAQRLFAAFMTTMDHLVALLDPQRYTFDYTRRYPLLFTAILAVSARFFAKAIYRNILSHAQLTINRAVQTGSCSLELIQAIIIMVFWKEPDNRAAWVNVGIAVRLGYQLRLHDSAMEERLSPSELGERRRTWWCLSCADRAYAELANLPTAISFEHCGEIPIEPQPYRLANDAHLACSLASGRVHNLWMEFKQSPGSFSETGRRLVLRDLYGRLKEHLRSWFPEDQSKSVLAPIDRAFLKSFDLVFSIKVASELWAIAQDGQKADYARQCLELASDMADVIDQMSAEGILPYIQDTSAALLSAVGMTIHKMIESFDREQTHIAAGLLKRVARRCVEATFDDTAATALVARFLQHILHLISQESRAVSRRGSPVAGSGDIDSNLFDMDVFLRDMFQATAANGEALGDNVTWESLFNDLQVPPFPQ